MIMMVEIEKLVARLKWEIELLDEVHPQAIKDALEESDMADIDSVFASKDSLTEFLDQLYGEIPFASSVFMRTVAEQIREFSSGLKADSMSQVDFDLITELWFDETYKNAKVFEPVDAQRIVTSIRDTELLAERLAQSGPWRRFGFDNEVLDRLEDLKGRTPNFIEIIDCLMDAVSLAKRYNKPVRVAPILVVGEPGIGKSFFTDQLSQIMGIPLTRIAIDNLQIGCDIAGMSFAYSKSSPGAVFRVLTENDHASPLVILDELDKVWDNWGYGDPLAPLHNLLEPVSAKVFKDASFPMPIDASHVIWIATANSLSRVPATIRSRFEIFKVDTPSADQFDAILREICREISCRYPGVTFDEEVIPVLRGMTPREQRKLLERVVGRASRFRENRVTSWHIKQVMGRQEVQPRLQVVGQPKGYL